jgi:septum formation protein
MTAMLVLASASPRRQELLRNAGIAFEVLPAHIAEEPLPHENARDCAERLAREKAMAVAVLRPGAVVLGADTVVVIDSRILGKPVDAADAARMLRLLSGRVHEVITGVCLIRPAASAQYPVGSEAVASRPATNIERPAPEVTVSSESTLVTVSDLTDQDIASYVATGEPMDKAGAYAIQGIAARWIPRIEGDYSNVVGLPVALLYRMLNELPLR